MVMVTGPLRGVPVGLRLTQKACREVRLPRGRCHPEPLSPVSHLMGIVLRQAFRGGWALIRLLAARAPWVVKSEMLWPGASWPVCRDHSLPGGHCFFFSRGPGPPARQVS